MTVAIGMEMSLDTEVVAVVRASPRADLGKGFFHLEILYYGPPDGAVAVVAGKQVYLDPMACVGLVPSLRKAGCWARELAATDVAAASYEIKAAIRVRRVTADAHEALRAAMMYAMRRPLATAFAFDRRRALADQSVLNAAAFAMWGAKVPTAEIF